MKKIFLVLIAAAFVASESGLLMAQSGKPSTTEEVLTELLRTNRSHQPKKTTTETPRGQTQSQPTQPCVEKGCQLGTPQVVR
jgi:hypothetical protein